MKDPLEIILTIDGRGTKEKARILHALISTTPQEVILQRLQQLAGLEVTQGR
jgi:hypothetical protein